MLDIKIVRVRHILTPTGEEEYALEVWNGAPGGRGLLTSLNFDEAQAIVAGRLEATERHGLEDLTAGEVDQLRNGLLGALQSPYRYPRS